MYESFEPWHLRDNYKVKKVHAHSPPLSFFWGGEEDITTVDGWNPVNSPVDMVSFYHYL